MTITLEVGLRVVRQTLVMVGLTALVFLSWLSPMDAPAMQQVDVGLKRALVSFASARALNGVVSVLQGTQIGFQPGGLGATFAPGQIVAPINELVKHFSDLMLAASVAFGIQKVLIGISAHWAISLVLTVVAFAWASFYFKQNRTPAWLNKMLVIVLMLRFAIPLVTLGSDLLSQEFMAADYVASQQAIDKATGQATAVGQPNPPATGTGSWWSKLSGGLPTIPDFAAMKAAAEQATEHIVKLMVIFLLQTLVMPIFLLWGLYGVAKGVFEAQRYPIVPNSNSP